MTASARATSLHSAAASRSKMRLVLAMLGLVLLLLAVALVRLHVGSTGIGWPSGAHAHDILSIRLTRLALAGVAGIALAVSGVALQALLRNPLAEPYILGLSTGAGAGMMAQGMAMFYLGLPLGSYRMGALLGAMVSMMIVFLAGRRRGVIDPVGLLLTGVVLSTINGALIMLFNYMVGPGGIEDDLARWMMGYLQPVTSGTFIAISALTAAGLIVLLTQARAMDIATLSESEARSLGVNVAWLRTLLFLIASVLAAGAVLLAGPIAFVGLICPHVARLLLGPRHGPLLIGSALAGATLIIGADVASELIDLQWHIGMMPIGIFTAMLGGPVFLWMLRPQLGRGSD